MAKAPFKAIIAALLCCWPALLWAAEPEDELRAAYACFRLDDLACARERLDRLLAVPGLAPDQRRQALLMRGDIFSERRQFDEALADFAQAEPLLPPGDRLARGEFARRRGQVHYRRGEYRLAEADYDLALAQNPQDARAYFLRGNLRAVERRNPEALADYGRSLEINPTHRAYYERSRVLESLGRREEAIRDMEAALALSPGRNSYQLRLGLLKVKERR